MKYLVNGLARIVAKSPIGVIVGVVLLSVVFGVFAGQVVQSSGNEGFAPDAPELLAIEEVGDLFGEESTESVIQVVVGSDVGDVLTGGGLATSQAVTQAIVESDMAPYLAVGDGERPPVVTFLLPVEAAVAQGQVPADADTNVVKAAFGQGLEALPPEQAGFVNGLLSADQDLAAPSASYGLMIIFVNPPTDTALFDEYVADVASMADDIAALDLPSGYTADPFSFELLFADQDDFQQEIGRLFGTAFIIIIAVLLFVFWMGRPDATGFRKVLYGLRRSAADTAVTLIAIVLAITWMNGVGALAGPKYLGLIADFNPMLQILPILLIGLGVDYSIHLTTRYREEVGEGATVTEGVGRAIHTVGIALVLATLTTMVGFLTNFVSPVPALKDFGILAAVGIGASFVLMLTFVPAVRLLLDRAGERKGTLGFNEPHDDTKDRLLPALIGKTSALAERIPVITLVAALILGGVGAWGTSQLETSFSFTDFVPRDNPLLDTINLLSDEFGGGFGETTQVLIKADDLATPQAHNALAASYGNMSDTTNVLQFAGFPSAESPLSVIGALVNPESPSFAPEVAKLAGQAGLSQDLTVSDGADVAGLYDAVLAADPSLAQYLHKSADGSYDAALFTVTTQAGETGAVQLGEDLTADFMPVVDAGGTAVATSEGIISGVVVEALQSSQARSLAITIFAAMLILVLNFWIESRRPLLGVITILPVALIVLWTFGAMYLSGIPFGPVTATISALAIGIGVPYTIHITHRFQEDRVRFATPEEAIQSTTKHTGGALAGSAFTTIAGFGILVTSSTVPFQQFGAVTVYAIAFALISAVLVLPSMLVLWDRWHRSRGEEAVDSDRLAATLKG